MVLYSRQKNLSNFIKIIYRGDYIFFYHEPHEIRFFPEKPHSEAQGRRGAEFLSLKFSFYYDILSFNEDHEKIKVIIQTTTPRLRVKFLPYSFSCCSVWFVVKFFFFFVFLVFFWLKSIEKEVIIILP
jgi:hypothetical protein